MLVIDVPVLECNTTPPMQWKIGTSECAVYSKAGHETGSIEKNEKLEYLVAVNQCVGVALSTWSRISTDGSKFSSKRKTKINILLDGSRTRSLVVVSLSILSTKYDHYWWWFFGVVAKKQISIFARGVGSGLYCIPSYGLCLAVRAGSGRGWKRVLVWRITVRTVTLVVSHYAFQRKGRKEGRKGEYEPCYNGGSGQNRGLSGSFAGGDTIENTIMHIL